MEALARRYEKDLTPLALADLPPAPEFQFLATDMPYGVSWAFTREWMGDYQVGYMAPPREYTVGRAVAASACFPPLFGPMRLRLDPAALKGGSAPRDARRDACLSDFRLTDGGDYDNMGLEPVWKSHAAVLVSDAGGLFTQESDQGLLWRIPRYQAIQERQARALRKRWLIASFSEGTLEGTYWGVGGAAAHYAPDRSPATPRRCRGGDRGDPHRPRRVLRRGGGGAREPRLPARRRGAVASRARAPRAPVPPAAVPHPDWYPPRRSEADIRAALAESGKRKAWGRRRA